MLTKCRNTEKKEFPHKRGTLNQRANSAGLVRNSNINILTSWDISIASTEDAKIHIRYLVICLCAWDIMTKDQFSVKKVRVED